MASSFHTKQVPLVQQIFHALQEVNRLHQRFEPRETLSAASLTVVLREELLQAFSSGNCVGAFGLVASELQTVGVSEVVGTANLVEGIFESIPFLGADIRKAQLLPAH
eukprot:m.90919 g.90919  ORF g.90919 m.90919 type:complete len:108 (+) comp51108_c0_seq1:68-391(+)